MSGPLDVGDLISLLETSDLVSGQQVKELVLENLRSTKEGWLVNALIDSYVVSRSGRCLDIIAAVNEPHDKFVFDRLLDHLRGPNKLAAVTILATLVYKRPSWLHKVVHNSVFSQLLKCLKNEADVPVLLSGLLVVTAILPILPSTIHQFLPHIFETFGRLASLCLKAPANVSELYKYHLQVGVYCLHNRLYGMFPYHFLTYLRNIYSRPEQQQVFEHIIKPMVDKLRLHPQLFTTTRQKETDKERWRQKEVHDILVECAQFSLDLTEGSTTEMSTPGPQRMADHFLIGQKLHHAMADLASPVPGSLVYGVDPASVLGLQRSGVATPPPGHETPSATSTGARGPTPIYQGAAIGSPAPEAEKTPKAKKRLSQSGLSLVGKIPTPNDPPIFPEGHCSVPPSPLKPDFASDPPLAAHRMQAMRRLSFHQSESLSHQADVGRALEKVLANTEKFPPRKPAADMNAQLPSDKTDIQPEDTIQDNIPGQRSSTELSRSTGLPAARQVSRESGDFHMAETLLEASLDRAVGPPASDMEAGPSVTQLPRFLDTLDSHAEDTTDNEVTEITTVVTEAEDDDEYSESSDTPSHLPAHLNTAESVAAFRKKVNRLRFNSINMVRDTASSGKLNKTERSRSCPNFDLDNDGEHETQVTEYRASTLPKQKVPRIPSMADTQKKMTRCNSSQTSLYALSTMMLDNKKRAKSPGVPVETSTEADLVDADLPFENFPYQELFSMSLPFSPYVQCYSCVMSQTVDGSKGKSGDGKSQPALDDRLPLFASYSPTELLDRILDQGQMIHDSDQAASPGGSRTLAPEVSSCADVTLLRGQIDMMHNQLMFERHKREMHAQRNRRLLGRIVKTTALEEQNNAMKDQLLLQERELLTLRRELTQEQIQCQQLKQAAASHETEAEKTAKAHKNAVESLRNLTKELECQREEAKAERDKANKAMQALQFQVYTLSKEVETLTTRSAGTSQLKAKVQQLNKELLLMGELQQKYQSRLVALNTAESSSTHQQFLLEAYKVELNSVKNNFGQKTIQADHAEKRLEDCQRKLQTKDELVERLKHMMEAATDAHSTQREAVEDKYQAMKRAHLSLQTEFLTLNHQLGCLKAAEQRAQHSRPAPRLIPRMAIPIDASGASTGTEGADWTERQDAGDGRSQGGSGLRTPDCLVEWSAPASVGSVESAEEAVAMDTSQ